jgi:CBS domain-containing protein
MNLDTPITQIMVTDPVTVEIGNALSDVHKALAKQRFHHVPVVENQKLVGIISEADLLRHGLADEEPSSRLDQRTRIADIMRTDLITVSDRATVSEAAQRLSAGGFHSLPVVDQHDHLRGLVTSTDLIEFLLETPIERPLPADLEQRLEQLERVFKAAKLYLHSGLAETEHARLERAIEAAR